MPACGATSWPQLRQITWPARAKSRPRESWISVIVPTVLRLEWRPWRLARPRSRGDSRDQVGVGFVELCQELARVGREGLDVAPLALGVERVEGQRALARAAHARSRRSTGGAAGRGRALEVMGPDAAAGRSTRGACAGSGSTRLSSPAGDHVRTPEGA